MQITKSKNKRTLFLNSLILIVVTDLQANMFARPSHVLLIIATILTRYKRDILMHK